MGTSAQSTSLRVTASTVSGREGKGAILIRPSEPVSSCLVMPRNAWRHSSVKVPSGPRKPIAFAKDTRGCISLDAGERWASPGQFRLFTCRPDGGCVPEPPVLLFALRLLLLCRLVIQFTLLGRLKLGPPQACRNFGCRHVFPGDVPRNICGVHIFRACVPLAGPQGEGFVPVFSCFLNGLRLLWSKRNVRTPITDGLHIHTREFPADHGGDHHAVLTSVQECNSGALLSPQILIGIEAHHADTGEAAVYLGLMVLDR